MIQRFGAMLSRFAHRAMPDPFVLALMLTVLVAVIGAVHLEPNAGTGVAQTLLQGWLEAFAAKPLLAFALQMCLVLVTGHALALSPAVQRGVARLSRLPKTSAQAAFVVGFVACASAMIHWGLGAIVGAFLAREIGRHALREGRPVHYPLLGAAAYAGLAVWHGGLSASAPLKVAEEGHFAAEFVGVIPVQATLFSPLNLAVSGGLLLLLPLLFAAMTPKEEDFVPPEGLGDGMAERTSLPTDTLPAFLQENVWVGRCFGLLGLGAVAAAALLGQLRLDLNAMNLVFLSLGIALQGSLRHYAEAIADGAKGAGAIVLQFPFYFGILGLMKAAGLIEALSETFVSWASAESFPILAFVSAGLVNLVVPSGGGQWAVQGEVLLEAAHHLGATPATVVMAFSYGDAWTNTLQPFWALPLLGIMGLRAKDIVGFTGVACLAMGIYVPLMLWLFG